MSMLLVLISCKPSYSQLAAEGYVIHSEGDSKSERWAEYLLRQLQKRSENPAKIQAFQQGADKPKGYLEIYIQVDPEAATDYQIKLDQGRLWLLLKNDRVALWMVYQLIDRMAEVHPGISSEDLPPAFLDFKDQSGNYDFIYREPHYQPNTDQDYSAILNTQNVDSDWGIWGHNLGRILEDQEGLFAQVQGKITKEQYCFSSAAIFNQLDAYILDNYGRGEQHSASFMIAPNDNHLTCTCSKCSSLGNKAGYSSPAVVDLLNKLAERYPFHEFYSIAYASVSDVPPQQLAENAGIFISTVDLPKGVSLKSGKSFEQFKKQVADWSKKTRHIYAWDYSSNFDDYLSPQPSLLALQAQLQVFKDMGINGLFINASGYDYSSFDDVKTYVSAALLINHNLDVAELTKRYFKRFYPSSYALVSDYYLRLEEQSFRNGKGYSMYAGFDEITQSYLDVADFQKFYVQLQAQFHQASGEERIRLRKLFAALGYTHLQLAYQAGLKQNGAFELQEGKVRVRKEILDELVEFESLLQQASIAHYKESDGELDRYIQDWRAYSELNQPANQLQRNQISSSGVNRLSSEELDLLSNGVLGFPDDFHQGWIIRNGPLQIQLNPQSLTKNSSLSLRFMLNKRHRLNFPASISIKQEGRLILKKELAAFVGENGRIQEINIPLSKVKKLQNIELILSKPTGANQRLAMDEIQLIEL